MSIETRHSSKTVPLETFPPPSHPEFAIIASSNSRIGSNFDLTISTQLSREEVYELMRTKYVPIALDNIQTINGGYNLSFPDHISSEFAGEFFHAYLAGLLIGEVDPIAYALKAAEMHQPSAMDPVLDPSFYSTLIKRYYDKIDAGDVEWVIGMFAPGATYARADTELVGLSEIAVFYRSERKIAGRHLIDEPIVSDSTVIVRGIFQGSGVDGSPKNVRFSDIWKFDERLVMKRETYLALGSDYVKE